MQGVKIFLVRGKGRDRASIGGFRISSSCKVTRPQPAHNSLLPMSVAEFSGLWMSCRYMHSRCVLSSAASAALLLKGVLRLP